MTDKDEAIEPAYKTFVRNSRGEIVMEHAWFSTTQVNQLICRAIEAERAKLEPYGIHVKPDGEYEVWISKTPR